MIFDYDLFVIGAGSGGLAASKRAASYGAKVAIAEGDLVGGTCVIRGCVPKKLMVYASEFSHRYQEAIGYGWSQVQPSFDWQQFITTIDKEVNRLSRLHINLLAKAGVELIQGYATFVDTHTIKINQQLITADKILIAVGGKPTKINIAGIEHAITSNEMFHLPEQPKHIAILGAGYIGVEFAGIMNGLGSQVTQIFRGAQILNGFDEDIRLDIQQGMEKHGIRMISNAKAEKIEKVPEGLRLTLSSPAEILTVDTILCATGRIPNLTQLGLEKLGVNVASDEAMIKMHKVQGIPEMDAYGVQGAIAVDEYSRTTQENIFAVGDCTDRLNLTPVAIGEGRAFADTEFGDHPRHISYSCVPSAVFSQPEAATVGMTETQAREKLGEGVKCYRARFRPMFHTLTGRDEKTLVKLVVDAQSDRVLGAHMVGEHAAEIIQGMAIAINMGATKKDFDATIGIHPSTAEEFVTLR
jgi:glutathione reductase (NADPH)